MISSRKPLLIVPIRDRRQRRRFLTIRNCAISMLSIAVVVAAISVYNNSHRGPATPYGRLLGTQDAAPKGGIERKVDVIDEGAIADQVAADPMLVAPAAREQLLMANSNVPAPAAKVSPAPALPNVVSGDLRATTIVGDSTGVAIVHPPATSSAPPKVLAGGIFKQQ